MGACQLTGIIIPCTIHVRHPVTVARTLGQKLQLPHKTQDITAIVRFFQQQ